jgi:copper chaperone CopZ
MTSPSPSPAGAPSAGQSALSTAEFAVEGMHCGSCVALIEETLGESEGVATASVDLDSGRAVVGYQPTVIGVDAIRTIITDTGYPATPVG